MTKNKNREMDMEWAPNMFYDVGDRCRGGWECLVEHTSGTDTFEADRMAHPNYWRAA